MKSIGEKIRHIRLKNAWKPIVMAEKLNMSVPGYMNIERDNTHISVKRLCDIAEIFQVDISYFLLPVSRNYTNAVTELNTLRSKLKQYENEISRLQERLISLYEEAERMRNRSKRSPGKDL